MNVIGKGKGKLGATCPVFEFFIYQGGLAQQFVYGCSFLGNWPFCPKIGRFIS